MQKIIASCTPVCPQCGSDSEYLRPGAIQCKNKECLFIAPRRQFKHKSPVVVDLAPEEVAEREMQTQIEEQIEAVKKTKAREAHEKSPLGILEKKVDVLTEQVTALVKLIEEKKP